MKLPISLLVASVLVAVMEAQSPPTKTPAQPVDRVAMESAARAFMAAYAADLTAQNRERLIACYHPDGALMINPWQNSFGSAAQIADFYRKEWKGPAGFTWGALRYSALSSDVMLVDGTFTWRTSTASTTFSYHGVLVKVAGNFRVRSEIEFPEK